MQLYQTRVTASRVVIMVHVNVPPTLSSAVFTVHQAILGQLATLVRQEMYLGLHVGLHVKHVFTFSSLGYLFI